MGSAGRRPWEWPKKAYREGSPGRGVQAASEASVVGTWGAHAHKGCLRLPMSRQAFGESIQTSDESKDTNHHLGADGAPGTCWLCVRHPRKSSRGPCKRSCALFHLGTLRPREERARTRPRLHSHGLGGDPRAWYLAQGSCSVHTYYNVTTINSIK